MLINSNPVTILTVDDIDLDKIIIIGYYGFIWDRVEHVVLDQPRENKEKNAYRSPNSYAANSVTHRQWVINRINNSIKTVVYHENKDKQDWLNSIRLLDVWRLTLIEN